jgi:tripartite-type tricarboxylate transporter receptor subunit TctC
MVGDLLAGHVQLASMGFPPAIPQVKNGKLRAIAVTGAQRSALLPEVPTVRESGLPGYEVTSWYGLFAPVALSKDIVNKVSNDVLSFLNAPDFKERLATLGAEPAPMKPDEFARHVRADIQASAGVIRASATRCEERRLRRGNVA